MIKRQKKISERILAAALSAALCVSYVPLNVIAEDEPKQLESVTETTVQTESVTEESETSESETTSLLVEETEIPETTAENSETEISETKAVTSEQGKQENPATDNENSVYTLQLDSIFSTIAPFYEITVNDSKENLTVNEGDEITIRIRAIENTDNHYRISSVRIGSKILDAAGLENYKSTVRLTSDMTDGNGIILLSAEFTQVYTVHFSYDSTTGSVNPTMEYTVFEDNNPAKAAGSVILNTDESVGFTATPAEHYRVSEIRIDDNQESYTENDKIVTVENLEANQNHTVEVIFALNTYQVAVEAEIQHGTVNVNSENIDYGGTVEVTVQPDEGSYIKSLLVNDVPVDFTAIQDGKFQISEITENQHIQAEFGTYAEEYSWNAEDAILQQDNSYIFGKNKNIVFTTGQSGIRLISENDAVIVGDEISQSVSIPYQEEKITVCAVELYDSGSAYTEAGWHRITLENKIEISFYGDISAEFVRPELDKDCSCYGNDVRLELKIDIPEGYPDIASIEYWLDGETEHRYLENDTREIIVSAEENNRAGIVAHAVITDTSGTATTISSQPFSINITIPTIKVSTKDTLADGANNGYYNSARTFSVTISDRADTFNTSLDTFSITKDGKLLTDAEKSSMITWSSEKNNLLSVLKFSDDGVYKWNMLYTNTAGKHNEGMVEGDIVYSFIVDSEVESASVTVKSRTLQDVLNVLTFGVFEKSKVTVTAEGTDDLSGMKEISYFKVSYTENPEYSFAEPLKFDELEKLYQDGEFSVYSDEITIDANETAVVYVRFMDGAGNVVYRSSDGIIVENQESEILLTPAKANEHGIYTDDVSVHIDVTDGFPYSGIQTVEYWVESGGRETQRQKLYEFEKENPAYNDLMYKWNGDVTIDSRLNNSSNIVLYVQVTDNAGNSSVVTEKIDINTTAPTIEISYDNNNLKEGKYFDSPRTATVVITDREGHFDEESATNGISITAIDADGKNVENAFSISKWVSVGDKHTAEISFSEDANYDLSIRYQSLTGLATSYITADGSASPSWFKTFTIDTTPPAGTVTIEENKWDELLNVLTFGIYSKGTFNVKLEGRDDTSPVRICYYISEDTAPLDKEYLDDLKTEDWTMFGNRQSGEIKLSEKNKTYVVYLKIVDYAGNYSYVCSDGHIIDNTKPNIVLNPEVTEVTISNKPVYNTVTGVPVEVTVTEPEPYSGLNLVEYWIESNDIKTEEGTLYNFEDEKPFNVTSGKDGKPFYETLQHELKRTIVVKADENNSSDVKLHVHAVDNAGNETDSVQNLDIDTTAPTITVDYGNDTDNNGNACFSKERTATVTIMERSNHFNQNAADEAIKIQAVDADGNPVEHAYMISNWTTSSGSTPDEDTHTVIIQYYADANYIFSISYTDTAGNINTDVDTGDSVAPYRFTIDKTAPIGTITAVSEENEEKTWGEDEFFNNKKVSFGLFSKTKVTVTADVMDNLSDIAEVVYFKDTFTENFSSLEETAKTTEELEEIYQKKIEGKSFASYPYGITMDANEKAVIYARFTDHAGNVSYLRTDGLIADNQEARLLSIHTDKDESKRIQNRAVTFTVEVDDLKLENKAFSGIKEIYYFVTKDDEKIGENHLIYQWSDAENKLRSGYKGNFTLDPDEVREYNQDDLNVSVIVIDNAGNIYGDDGSIAEVVSINIDEMDISVTFEDEINENRLNDSYFQSRKATVRIENDRASSFNSETANQVIIDSITATEITDIFGNSITNSSDLITISDWHTDWDNKTVHYAEVSFNYCGNYTWKNNDYVNDAGNKKNILDNDITFTIDNVNPIGSVTVKEETWSRILDILTFGIYDQERFEVSASGDDATSPVRIDYYISNSTVPMNEDDLNALSNENWVFYSDKEHEGNSFTLDNPENYVIYVRITDYAGNRSYISSDGHIIDGESCQIEVTLDPPNENQIYNKDIHAHIDVADPFPYSGIHTVEYAVITDGIETKHETLYQFEKVNASYDELDARKSWDIIIDSKTNNSCNVELYVKAIDNTGRISETTKKLDIDATPPSISVSYDNNHDNNGNTYFDADRIATVVITERSHHFDAQAATNGIIITAVDGYNQPIDESYTISQWNIIPGETPDKDTHTATIHYRADANYTFSISYTDKADNANTEVTTGNSAAPFKFTVDTVPPTGTITALSAEGREETWDELVGTLSFGFWSNTNINITGTSDDITSPVASVQYYKYSSTNAVDATEALTIENLNAVKDWQSFSELNIKPNEQFTIYLKLMDMAGNISYISTNGLIVDDNAPQYEMTAPEINITPERTESGIYNGDVTVSVTVDDPLVGGTYSGLRIISYRVLNMGTETQNGTLFTFEEPIPLQSNLQKTWTGEITVDSNLNNSNNVVIEVYAQDNALNASTKSISVQIDTTPPEITVSYSNNTANGDLFKNGRTAQISIRERNFSREYVNLTVTRNGADDFRTLEWTSSGGTGNGDDTIWYAELPFTPDGDYTFAIDCTDLAANKSAETLFAEGTICPNSFTIDATSPQISVVFTDTDDNPKNSYYKEPRTATITIVEQHFDKVAASAGVVITGDNDGNKVETVLSDWNDNGNTHTATVVFSEDAKYHLSVEYTDIAGNKGEAFTSDFYVDKTNPSLKLAVNDREKFGAYKDDVIPVISYHDVNFDADTEVFIEMSGINVSVSAPIISGDDVTFMLEAESGKKIEWKAAFETNDEHYGKVLTFEDFPSGDDYKEFDDIYTLTVSLEDKAGRTSADECVFSVNRYGSTYDISAVKNMLNMYMQEGSTVTVKEINPDELVKHSVTLFEDSEPSNLHEKSDYELESSGIDGEWHSYTYTINQTNFEDNGVYEVRFDSTDKAGNPNTNVSNKNTEDTAKSDINFAVDKIPPVANVLNLEDGKTYVEQSRTVLMTADDNIKLEDIKVYLDNDAEIYQSWNTAEIENRQTDDENEFKNQYSFDITGDSVEPHNLRIVCTDASGRVTELAVRNFYITTNPIIPWLRKYGWILGIVGVAGIILGIIKTKKHNNGGA